MKWNIVGIFKRKPKIVNDGAADFGLSASAIGEASEGGPSPFRHELNQLRLIHAQESINISQRGIEPSAWQDGRVIFDHEFALAHSHQALRERVQVWVRSTLSNGSEELFENAQNVVDEQHLLMKADEQLEAARRDYGLALDELSGGHEKIRFQNRRNSYTVFFKWLIAAIFIFSELLMTGFVFNKAIDMGSYVAQMIFPYVLAVGVMVIFIAGPHFLAKGLKALGGDELGESSFSSGSDNRKVRISARQLRSALWIFGVSLVALMIPLSILRAQGTSKGNKALWFALFFFVQLGVSTYFFVREWLDSGVPAENLHNSKNELDAMVASRDEAAENYGSALVEYLQVANPLMKSVLDLFRHDGQIVEEFFATIHYGRHAMILEQPSLAAFVNGARLPYLGSRSEIEDDRGLIYDAVSSSNRIHEESSPRGRDWWPDLVEAVAEKFDNTGVASPIVIDELSLELLYKYLRENWGLSPYRSPRPPTEVTVDGDAFGQEAADDQEVEHEQGAADDQDVAYEQGVADASED